MKRLLLAVGILVVLSACSGKSTPAITPTPTLPYVKDLQSALLGLSDLPSGWVSLPGSSSNELSPPICDMMLPDVRMVAATAVFQTDSGAHLSETIAALHPGDAEQWLTALQDGPSCNQINEGENLGTPITAQVTLPAYPAMGDQSFSLRITSDFGGGRYVSDVIYVRAGDFIIQLGTVTIGSADTNFTTSLVQKAIDRLRAAQL